MNWIGILEEHKSQSKAPESTYKFNQVDLNWTCELSIPWCPVAFGGRNATFQKKQAAKADAAKKAVEWLLENGIMGKNGGVTLSWAAFEKRMKAAMDPDMAGEGNEAANHIDEMINDALQDDTEEFDRSTMAETVHHMCFKLGIQPPVYRFVADPDAVDFTSCSAHLWVTDPYKEEQVVGEVHNVFGKKTARMECAGQVLRYLVNMKHSAENLL